MAVTTPSADPTSAAPDFQQKNLKYYDRTRYPELGIDTLVTPCGDVRSISCSSSSLSSGKALTSKPS